MVWPNLFPEKCSISAPAVDFRFVDDCVVLPAPSPIWDAPDIEILPQAAPPAVPDAQVECPTLDFGTGSLTVAPCVEAAINFTGEVEKVGDLCAITLDLDLTIPQPPCPTFDTGSASVDFSWLGACEKQAVALAFTIEPPEPCASICDYKVELDLTLGLPMPPCPSMTAGEGALTLVGPCEPGSVTMMITEGDPCGSICEFLFDLDIQVPQTPCPTVSATGSGELTMISQCLPPTITFNVTADPVDPCDKECVLGLDILLEMELPDYPTPVFNFDGDIDLACGAGTIEAIVTAGGDCPPEYDVELSLHIPLQTKLFRYTGTYIEASAFVPPALQVVEIRWDAGYSPPQYRDVGDPFYVYCPLALYDVSGGFRSIRLPPNAQLVARSDCNGRWEVINITPEFWIFWAIIISNTGPVAGKYTYHFHEVVKSTAGYGGWIELTGGRQDAAFNAAEETATTEAPAAPIDNNTVVRMSVVGMCSPPEYWFDANGGTGEEMYVITDLQFNDVNLQYKYRPLKARWTDSESAWENWHEGYECPPPT